MDMNPTGEKTLAAQIMEAHSYMLDIVSIRPNHNLGIAIDNDKLAMNYRNTEKLLNELLKYVSGVAIDGDLQ